MVVINDINRIVLNPTIIWTNIWGPKCVVVFEEFEYLRVLNNTTDHFQTRNQNTETKIFLSTITMQFRLHYCRWKRETMLWLTLNSKFTMTMMMMMMYRQKRRLNMKTHISIHACYAAIIFFIFVFNFFFLLTPNSRWKKEKTHTSMYMFVIKLHTHV